MSDETEQIGRGTAMLALAEARELAERGGDAHDIVKLLTTASNGGISEADYALGTFYLHGKYVHQDMEQAIALLKRAADAMYPPALFDLAVALEKGEGRKKKSRKAAFECYVLAMVLGDRDAIFEVARCAYYGIGTKRNRKLYEILTRADDFLKTSD